MSHTPIRQLAVGLLMATALAGCGPKSAQHSPEEQAAAVAKSCYEALYNGHTELFLDGRDGADAMPEGYRQQLIEAYSSHARQVARDHHGVNSVSVSRAAMDSTLQVMQVFLVLDYGNATKEEIVVPMVERDGHWLMK